jgi:hypothetical protein
VATIVTPLDPDPRYVPDEPVPRPTGAELARMSDRRFRAWLRREGLRTSGSGVSRMTRLICILIGHRVRWGPCDRCHRRALG